MTDPILVAAETADAIREVQRQGSTHYTLRCVCGRQITTCRCIGPKDIWEVQPCRHQPAGDVQIRLVHQATTS